MIGILNAGVVDGVIVPLYISCPALVINELPIMFGAAEETIVWISATVLE